MPFRFGSFRFLSKLEMCKTPLTDRSTVHTVGFRHLETRPVVSIFRSENQNVVLGRTLSRVREHPRACRPSRACPLEPQYVGASSAYSLFFASCPNHNHRTHSITIKFCDGSKTLHRDLGRN
ncbi:hypothetical protein V1477_004076 [Vespula maculifrons]|uniref:Uncharacterized protein n=1 Tax=Vespula maculifrons TaxID=7453 RepID=A0ABD2CQI9_VESMC